MKKITLLFFLTAFFVSNAQLIDEGFDDITTLTDYQIINVSDSPGTTDFFQGNDAVFPAFDGGATSYIGCNFNATAGSTIDLYLLSPQLTLENDDIITFYTRTGAGSTFPDRLEVRLDPTGTGTAPTAGGVGSYSSLLLEINPTLATGGYPETWQQQSITISGLAGPVTTRFAFRYWVTNGGPTGANSNYVGIDRLVVTEALSIDDEIFNDFTFFVDPNEMLNLNARTPLEFINVYDVTGQNILSRPLNNSEEKINVSQLATGVYFAKINSVGATKTIKFIKP